MRRGAEVQELQGSSSPPRALPLHVGPQERDSQQEVHHDGAHHHGQSQQNRPVLSCFQCCDSFPFVQEVMVPDFLVNISKIENNKVSYEVLS